jgi:hypothetical protein
MPTSEPAPTLALDRLFLRTAAEAVQYLAAVPGMPREDLMRIARTLCGAGEEIERLRARVAELEAERDEYARVALVGLSGIVGTPEKGYLRDGGPGQLAADLRTLRAKVASLQAQLDLTRRHIPKGRS